MENIKSSLVMLGSVQRNADVLASLLLNVNFPSHDTVTLFSFVPVGTSVKPSINTSIYTPLIRTALCYSLPLKASPDLAYPLSLSVIHSFSHTGRAAYWLYFSSALCGGFDAKRYLSKGNNITRSTQRRNHQKLDLSLNLIQKKLPMGENKSNPRSSP